MRRLFSRVSKDDLLKIAAGIIAYLLLLAVYMQPVITNGCTTTYLGGPGDQSAFAWLYKASPNSPPLWGPTTWTNAPYGENLSEPFFISGLLQYTSVWIMQKVVGPTCAFNIYASFGYIFTATMMFLFILWLTNRRNYFVAWFAGYLIAFAPYLQIKTMHHASYVYSGLLIAILWLFMLFWRRPRMSFAVGLVLLGAALFYHDPYFIMLGVFLLMATLIGIAIFHGVYEKIKWADLWIRLKYLLFVLPIFVILIAPVIYVRISQSSQIESVVSNSRNTDIMAEGRAYSARPWEFVLPATTSPLTPESLKKFQNSHQHGTDNIETTLFLGYTSIVLAGFYALYWFRYGAKERRPTRQKQQLATLIAGSLTLVGGLMSLPPFVHIGPITLYFPSWLMLSLTTMWRMPARFFIILQIGLVVLAVFGFLYLIQKYGKYVEGKKRYIVYGFVLTLSMLEFATFNPFYRRYWAQSMIPSVYNEVKDNKNVDMIAEYPMLDPPRNFAFIFYLSYQAYHQKPMINSAKAGSPTKLYRESMADLYDWQTPGALKRLSVDRVLVHGVEGRNVSSPYLIRLGESYDNQTTTPVTEFMISESVQPKNYLLTISQGFDGPSNYGFMNVDYYMHKSGTLKPVLLPGAKAQSTAIARIQYYGFEKTSRLVKITQEGKVVTEVRPTESKQIIEFAIDPSKPIVITPTDPPSDYSFVISNMEIE